jgi:hypothetical protein
MKTARLVLVAGSLFLLTTLVASAAPPDPPHPGPAMFTEWPDCFIFDTEFEWYYIPDCRPTITLEANSQTGVLHWTAKAQLPEGAALPEKGAHKVTYENSGFSCWWDEAGEVRTTNYSITITPNGKFNIECHFRPDKWQPE